jgi:cytochrome c peroxidase
MSARVFAAVILATVAMAIFGGQRARAVEHPPKPGPLSEPKSTHQAGFPEQLYKFSIPADNPQTPAKVALGKALFFDPRLSADNTQACASCHDPDKGFSDQQATSDGIHHQFGKRNAPTVLNSMFNVEQFWDGRAHTLEDQAKAASSKHSHGQTTLSSFYFRRGRIYLRDVFFIWTTKAKPKSCP